MLVQNCEGSCEETKKNSSLCAADHSRILQMHCGPSWALRPLWRLRQAG